MANTIGWIGLGRMGEAMVKRLLKAGHPVRVWNRTASKAAPLVEYGATIAGSKQELSKCDVVFTMVSTTDDLKEVLFGDGGLAAGATKPKVVVDSSSISQEGSAEIRSQLEALGVAYLCTPVSGNAKVAKAGGAGLEVHALQDADADESDLRSGHVHAHAAAQGYGPGNGGGEGLWRGDAGCGGNARIGFAHGRTRARQH